MKFPFVKGRLSGWAERWENVVPFSAFTIRKSDDGSFLGTMVLGGADEPNSAEIAYMIRHTEWGKGFGFEAVNALMKHAASVHCKGTLLPNGDTFSRVVATCRQDNERSSKILQKLGFKVYETSDKFGNTRDHYEYKMNQ